MPRSAALGTLCLRSAGPLAHHNTTEDFGLANNLASKEPQKLKSLEQTVMKEAEKYHLLPVDGRTLVRTNAALVDRPTSVDGHTSMTLSEGMKGMGADIFINLRNTSYSINAEVEVMENGNGVIVCQVGKFGSCHVESGEVLKPGKSKSW